MCAVNLQVINRLYSTNPFKCLAVNSISLSISDSMCGSIKLGVVNVISWRTYLELGGNQGKMRCVVA